MIFRYAIMTELTIKMTVYNKLKLAILAIIASQTSYAINVDPVQVQSAPGELLYAEMTFRQSDINTPLEVSLATPEDLIAMGAVHQPPGHLNFFTRRNSNGTGVITITSSRPVTDRELNIIVKIKEGNAARLQHIRTSLQTKTDLLQASLKQNEHTLSPVVVASEKDIALNLPVSTQYHPAPQRAQAVPPAEKSLVAQSTTPPPLSSSSIPKALTASHAVQPEQTVTAESQKVATQPVVDSDGRATPAQALAQTDTTQSQVSLDPLVQKYQKELAQKQAQVAPTQAKALPKTTAPQAASYVVQSNESLWSIASRIAQEQQRPVHEIMQQVKERNDHAFIDGNVNRLRKGAALNLDGIGTVSAVKVANHKQVEAPTRPAAKTKYRLNEAEMSLVAENQNNSSHVSANQNTEQQQTSKELSLKVMTAREKTVKLQRNVTELELALNQKDHKIQLLNARLAQLQQQLKAQQVDKKPTH